MTYQGIRATLVPGEIARVFEVSQVRLDRTGHVADVWWSEVNSKSDLDVGAPVAAPVSEVVTALHDGHRVIARFASADRHVLDREFVAVEHPDGHESVTLAGPPSPGREIGDIARATAAARQT